MKIRLADRRIRIGIALVLIILIGKFSLWEVRDMRAKADVNKMTETMKTVCVGRFLIDVPSDARIGFRGAFLSGWTIATRGDESTSQFHERLADKETELKSEKNEKGLNSLEAVLPVAGKDLEGKIFVFNRTWQYWFEHGKRIDSNVASAHAYVRVQNTSVDFTAEFGDTRVKELAHIVTQIYPLLENQIPTEPGFCFGDAMLVEPLTADQTERVTLFVGLKDHPDFLLALDTVAGLKPADPLLLRDDRIKGPYEPFTRTLRRGERAIGGVAGQELLERFSEKDGVNSYSFTWESYSKQDDVFRPRLSLEFSTDHAAIAQNKTIESHLTDGAALALWDKISSTIRVRPTTAAPARP